jgi:uncharacterized protein
MVGLTDEEPEMRKMVHLAVHDVAPPHAEVLEDVIGTLKETGAEIFSLFVVPNYHGEFPIGEFSAFCQWLNTLRDQGIELVLHGNRHREGPAALSPSERFKASIFTRGEGEFLGTDAEEAAELISEGREMVREALGCRLDAFAAPAWLYSRGSLQALAELGFRIAESRWRVWDPVSDRTLLRSPVSNFAGGGSLKRTAAAMWVRLQNRVLSPFTDTIRFAVHPEDFLDAGRRRRAVRMIEKLLRDRKPVTLEGIRSAP